MTTTNSWAGFRAAEPVMCKAVPERFGADTHHVLATLRADGSPRLTGLEADFHDGEMWLGMMPDSRKALDLRRDPRFAMHANPGAGAELEEGDVRVAGRAVELGDAAERGHHLFRVELTEVVRVYLEAPEICMDVWRPGEPLRTVRRR
jgi:hypothetical protein